MVFLFALGLIQLPFLFGLLGGDERDWERLSFIGQAYGSVSAIISAVALAGVVATFILQRRQTQLSAQYSMRQHHLTLMKMAMDDPSLMQCLGEKSDFSHEEAKQQTYINLLTTFWCSGWLVGDFSNNEMRVLLRDTLFSTEMGRQWWVRVAPWRAEANHGRLRKFDGIIEKAYREWLTQNKPECASEEPLSSRMPEPKP
ncbi:hypothetical protein Asi02nite_04880 [Asanoa siamensis]|uniref:DUF4760 domain-containing protein n=2 Tax=Asanoa siamensis TaxID=926357 RepID=A0ABQ4CI67_9ACTN|nr:hypothetical protein Asi02nite_04880 [Asanoa siamensis]